MKKIMKAYRPEDYKISENFVTACFKYSEHALAVLNGSEKVRRKFMEVPRSSRNYPLQTYHREDKG